MRPLCLSSCMEGGGISWAAFAANLTKSSGQPTRWGDAAPRPNAGELRQLERGSSAQASPPPSIRFLAFDGLSSAAASS